VKLIDYKGNMLGDETQQAISVLHGLSKWLICSSGLFGGMSLSCYVRVSATDSGLCMTLRVNSG